MTSADYNGLYKEQSGNANTDKHLMFGDHDPSAIDYNAIYLFITDAQNHSWYSNCLINLIT